MEVTGVVEKEETETMIGTMMTTIITGVIMDVRMEGVTRDMAGVTKRIIKN
jgi:hypothetical protein